MHVVESHHLVLPIWAEYRSRLECPPYLITLDHHTDTSLPFRNHLKKMTSDLHIQEIERKKQIEAIDFKQASTVLSATNLLSHDEHVLTAVQAGIIAGAFVVAQNARDTDIDVYKEHRVCCYSVSRAHPSSMATLEECDRVLESSFLQGALDHFKNILAQEPGALPLLENNYILDIDLDYFNTKKSIRPEDRKLFLKLAKGAGLVTIATEPDHVLKCAREDHVHSDDLLQELIRTLSAPV